MIDIDVGITAWPKGGFPERMVYLERVIAGLKKHLNVEGCRVLYTVSAEIHGVTQDGIDDMTRLCDDQDVRLIWHRQPPGLCHNIEFLVRSCDAPYFFYMQDDWLLDVPINLAEDVPLLDQMDILRYRWVGRIHEVRPLSPRFAEISMVSNWFYAHNPYLARKTKLSCLFPMGGRESQVNSKAKASGLKIAVHKPSIFKHIGGKSVMTPKKQRPVED
jgi:hypothetical protein